MSDTPRTDSECRVGFDGCTNITMVNASFARQLERELADANAKIGALEEAEYEARRQEQDAEEVEANDTLHGSRFV